MIDFLDRSRISLKSFEVATKLRKRHLAEKRFKLYGLVSIGLSLLFMTVLILNILANGWSGFIRTEIALDIYFNPTILEMKGERSSDNIPNYQELISASLEAKFGPNLTQAQLKKLTSLISIGGIRALHRLLQAHKDFKGITKKVWLVASSEVDMLIKSSFWKGCLPEDINPKERRNWRLNVEQLNWLQALWDGDAIRCSLNLPFFTTGDSREPELAGILAALVGSFYTLVITLVLAFPISVATALYLEEFSKRNKWSHFIELNINNLAAVPSIIFGLLGLAIFLNFFDLPRSAPLIGGMTLTLLIMPTIIIAARAALKSVPLSIREAARALGASQVQTVFHHVLPLALPGIATGTILGMVRALGESAPLLMIGMVAFIIDVPKSVLDPATALPVQIFTWARNPERAFLEKTSAAIIVLLIFLSFMNLGAIILRRKFDRRW